MQRNAMQEFLVKKVGTIVVYGTNPLQYSWTA